MPFIRWSCCAIALAACWAGCGGKSASHGAGDDADGEAGDNANGGTAATTGGSGGSTSATGGMGGSSTAAGGSGGSTASSGGSAGAVTPQAGRGGSGGMAATMCAEKPRPDCNTSVFVVYEPYSNECKAAGRTNCEPSDQPEFLDLADCLDACPGALPELRICDTASDCRLAHPPCCAACEPVAPADVISVNRQRYDSLYEDCHVACGACDDVSELERTGQYLIPTCGSHACGVTDLRATPATQCTRDSDCTLRDGSDCCEGCDGAGIIAVSNSDWLAQSCEKQDGCDACVPDISPMYQPACNDEARCVVQLIPF